ncbi:MAG: hypothetical protein NTX50_08265 [Candidatus Sumerlaeota bacterium]|nr:hypothetical protein [Candidatus Sumerlaeota bacterium]
MDENETIIAIKHARKLVEFERLICGLNTEWAGFFSASGIILYHKKGAPNEVEFSFNEISMIENKIVTHNHTRGGSLSTADVQCAVDYNLLEMRTVGLGPDGNAWVHRLRRPSHGWPSPIIVNEWIEEEWEIAWRLAYNECLELHLMEKIPLNQVNYLQDHVAMISLALSLNMNYSRVAFER